MTTGNESRPAGNGAAIDQALGGGSVGTTVVAAPDARRLPFASSSVYAQVGARTMLHVAATCPTCGAVTVHRMAGPAVDGERRRGACEHAYLLRVRRVYSPRRAS
jgi:hypothetical protein